MKQRSAKGANKRTKGSDVSGRRQGATDEAEREQVVCNVWSRAIQWVSKRGDLVVIERGESLLKRNVGHVKRFLQPAPRESQQQREPTQQLEQRPPMEPVILADTDPVSFQQQNGLCLSQLLSPGARSIRPNFPEMLVQNSMDRFGPTGKVSKKQVHLLRWSSFPGRTGLNVGWMDRAPAYRSLVLRCQIRPLSLKGQPTWEPSQASVKTMSRERLS